MIKKFVKFLQGYDIPVKALVLLICLGSFYSAIANNQNTVGHTQAIQSHLGFEPLPCKLLSSYILFIIQMQIYNFFLDYYLLK